MLPLPKLFRAHCNCRATSQPVLFVSEPAGGQRILRPWASSRADPSAPRAVSKAATHAAAAVALPSRLLREEAAKGGTIESYGPTNATHGNPTYSLVCLRRRSGLFYEVAQSLFLRESRRGRVSVVPLLMYVSPGEL